MNIGNQTVLLNINTSDSLIALSIPWIQDGGFFVPTSYLPRNNDMPKMGSVLNVLINHDEKNPYLIQGIVVLIQPKKKNQEHGVGIKITFDPENQFRNYLLAKTAIIDRNELETFTF